MPTTAGIVTVGDELLAGDVENTNATWIAARLTNSGVDVVEIRVVPDDTETIESAVSELGQQNTFVVTTGGLGSTPDDVTAEGVGAALDRPLESHPRARALVESAVAEIHEEHPDFRFDVDAASRYPADARIVPNDEGIAPGCVCGNVYVLPGIPAEMRAVFERVEEQFDGEADSRTLYTETAESHLNSVLLETNERFGVRVGCYPDDERKRIRLVSEDEAALEAAHEWLAAQPEVQTPASDRDTTANDR